MKLKFKIRGKPCYLEDGDVYYVYTPDKRHDNLFLTEEGEWSESTEQKEWDSEEEAIEHAKQFADAQEYEFQVGDRVRGVSDDCNDMDITDLEGEVVQVKGGLILVQFDEENDQFHSGGEYDGEEHRCWNCEPEHLELIERSQPDESPDADSAGIIIDGKEVFLNKNGKKYKGASYDWFLADGPEGQEKMIVAGASGQWVQLGTGAMWTYPTKADARKHVEFLREHNKEVVSSVSQSQGASVAMARNTKLTAHNCEVVKSKETKQILLPDEMEMEEAIVWLQRRIEDNQKEVGISYELEGFPLDVAVNFYDAMLDIYGFVEKVNTPGFWGPEPPVMIAVPTGPDTFRQVPWGSVRIPGVSGRLETQLKVVNRRVVGNKLIIGGMVKQKDVPKIEEVIKATKERLKTHSIYKGKAVELDLSWTRTGAFDPTANAPKFTIPTKGADKSRLIFSEQVQKDIDDGLFVALEQPEFCASCNIPVKRGVLLAGEFGVGKTMTAWVAAKLAVENGMGFIYLKDVADLAACFEFARQYQEPNGVVVFSEDINKAIGLSEDDDGEEEHDNNAINQLQNAFDGVNTKTDKIITVLTTNFLERVPQSLLRPGRIDLLVRITRPDGPAAARLVKQYGGDLIAPDIDMEQVGKAVHNHLPAEIREIVERSKMACIGRLCRENPEVAKTAKSVQGKVTAEDIKQAAHQMQVQHDLLKPKEVDQRSDEEKAAQILADGHRDAARIVSGDEAPATVDDSDLDYAQPFRA